MIKAKKLGVGDMEIISYQVFRQHDSLFYPFLSHLFTFILDNQLSLNLVCFGCKGSEKVHFRPVREWNV